MQKTKADLQHNLIIHLQEPPWSDGRSKPTYVVTGTTKPDAFSDAWNLVAPFFNQSSTDEVMTSLMQTDLQGECFYGTSDVETTVARVTVESSGEQYDLEAHFSVFALDGSPHWCVTVESNFDVEALRALLAAQTPPIFTALGPSVYEYEIGELKKENLHLQDSINTLLGLMQGFEGPLWTENWQSLPKLPEGITLARLLIGWSERPQRNRSDIKFLLWILSGRSMDLFQRVTAFRPDAVEGLKKAMIDVITKDHSQGWAVSGHHDPSHARFKKDLDALKHELHWLVKPSPIG